MIQSTDYCRAVECLSIAVDYTPNIFNLWRAKANMLMEVKEYSQAWKSATKCTELEPHNTAVRIPSYPLSIFFISHNMNSLILSCTSASKCLDNLLMYIYISLLGLLASMQNCVAKGAGCSSKASLQTIIYSRPRIIPTPVISITAR